MADVIWAADGRAAEIVRELAAMEMTDFEAYKCRFCGGNISDGLGDQDDGWFAYHQPDCVWVKARTFVGRQPKGKVNAL